MSIFQIEPDVTNYDSLLRALVPITEPWKQDGFDEWLDVSLFAMDGAPIADRWHPVPVEVGPAERRKNRGKPVDFLHFDLGSFFAVSERALSVITPLVGAVVEALPLDNIDRPERRYFMLNMLDLVDCLDEQRSDITRKDDGKIRRINRFAFRPGTTDGHHLFRLVQYCAPSGPILASSEFKRLVEENNLVGLEFHPIGEPLSDERSSVGKHAGRKPRMR